MRQQINFKSYTEINKAYKANNMLGLACADLTLVDYSLGLDLFGTPAYFIGHEPINGRLRCRCE